MASAFLIACGGGGGPLPVAGTVTNKVSPSVEAVVVAGQRLTIASEALANFDAISSQKWTVIQVGGVTTTIAPTVADASCAGANGVPGSKYSSNSLGTNGSSKCETQLVVPLDAPTSDWVVENIASTGAASAGGQFILKVIRQPKIDSGFGLNISDIPQIAVVEQTASLSASFSLSPIATLDGSVAYAWSQVSGPAAAIAGASAPTMTFTPHVAGDYVFKVSATATVNGKIEVREGTLVAAVGAAPVLAPSFTVSAGSLQSSLVSTSVTLHGIVGGPAAPSTLGYQWLQVSGPSTVLFGGDTLAPQFLPTETGGYIFELAATQAGTSPVVKTSRVLVTVYATATSPFFSVSAGDSQVVGPVPAAATLTGKLVVNDLAPLSVTYQWQQLSGPAVSLSNSTSLVSSFGASVTGLYVFELAATSGADIKTTTTSVLVK